MAAGDWAALLFAADAAVGSCFVVVIFISGQNRPTLIYLPPLSLFLAPSLSPTLDSLFVAPSFQQPLNFPLSPLLIPGCPSNALWVGNATQEGGVMLQIPCAS